MIKEYYTEQFAVDYNKKWRSSDYTLDDKAEIKNPYCEGSIVWALQADAINERIDSIDDAIANCLVNARNQL